MKKKKGNQKMRPIINRHSVKRAAGVLCLCIENMSTAAEGLCHSIGIQKSQVDNEMKRKEIFKKRRLGAALSFHLIKNLAEVFCEERKTRKEDPQRFTKSSMDMPVHWECKIWLLWS